MATLTCYPVAGANSPCDGFVRRDGTDQTLANIRAGAGVSADPSASELYVRLNSSGTTNQFSALDRCIFNFDTSSIPDGSTITSVVLSLYVSQKTTPLGETGFSLAIVNATPAGTNTLVAADYSQLGSTLYAYKDYGDITASAYNDFTLNASGIAAINKTGVTSFGAVSGWDYNNVFNGTWTGSANSYYEIKSADAAGTTQDPKLVVTYTPPAAFLVFM